MGSLPAAEVTGSILAKLEDYFLEMGIQKDENNRKRGRDVPSSIPREPALLKCFVTSSKRMTRRKKVFSIIKNGCCCSSVATKIT